jgi:RNA-directed DNA polymerase
MGLFSFLRKFFSPHRPPTSTPQPEGAPAPRGTPYSAGGSPAPSKPSPTAAAPRPGSKLNLDPGQFAPITEAELKKRAANLQWNWATVNFDRRDQIPPASHPRTELIDRALVAQGLLTPEQLAELHEIGDQWAVLRPELAGANAVAERAVINDAEERRARKAQKKAEAEQRRKDHAEAVAKRRATDIVFLGRGVSGGLADRRSNVEKLQSAGLPVLSSPADVVQALSLSIPRLRWLAFHSEAPAVTHYVRFQVSKKSGGTRELAAPHRDLARCQDWIRTQILDRVSLHEAAHGFVRGKNTVSNARAHLQKDAVVNADLKDFFPSITFPRVKGVFQQLGYSPAAATILALLCTECPRRQVTFEGRTLYVAIGPRGLPQGACTSPALSNLVARGLDSRLNGLARRLGWSYTRYADDLTFSADGEPVAKTGYLLTRLRHIVGDESFTVNEKKTRVQRPNTRQTVTGVVVNEHPNVSRETIRRIRAILHRAKTEGLAVQNRENHPRFESWLIGMIAYIQMVNPARGAELKAAYESLSKPS